MADIDVDLDELSSIATSLDAAADGLEDLARSVPSGIDAGPMTGFITSLVAQIVSSAGNVSTGLSGSAESVRQARGYYERSDASAQAGMDAIRKAMTP